MRLLSLGSAPTGEEASPSSQGGTPATRERRACRSAKTKEAFGEQGRRFGIRNRREIKGDRSELHQSRGNEVEYKGITLQGAFPQTLFLLNRSSQQPPLPEINTLYPPRLRVDDVGVSTNSSLAINSAALKNLDDRQLTQMARRRPAVEQADVMQQLATARNKPYEDTGSEDSSSLTRRVVLFSLFCSSIN